MNLNRSVCMLFITLMVALAGCHSSIVPLRPAAIGPPWARRLAPASARGSRQPASVATSPSAAHPVGPSNSTWFANAANGTTRTIALTHYRNIWRHTIHLLINMGYHIQWASYRLGVITTRYRTGPEILQWWRPDATTFPELIEGTINTFRRIVRVVITRNRAPHTFAVTVEVLVQRRENPSGAVGPVAFFGSSAFGNNPLPIQSHAPGTFAHQSYWMRIGHDPALEKKILRHLFRKL